MLFSNKKWRNFQKHRKDVNGGNVGMFKKEDTFKNPIKLNQW